MKKHILPILLVALICMGCSSDDNGSNGNNGGGILVQATYKITFAAEFSATSHPTDYPSNASFDKVFVMAHGNASSLFKLGQPASQGLELYAEDGDTDTLENEHSVGANSIIIGNPIGPTETYSTTITITPDRARISFVSKISPSPDWFVGIDSFNLLNADNSLVEEKSFKLYAIDAGTDAGTTYTSDDVEDDSVTMVFTDPPVGNGGPINEENRLGLLTIERVYN